MRVLTCRTCQDNGPDVAYRPTLRSLLCVGCYLDAIAGSTTRALVPTPANAQDGYTLLAAKHGF